jgi:hypothetical protein
MTTIIWEDYDLYLKRYDTSLAVRKRDLSVATSLALPAWTPVQGKQKEAHQHL